MHHDFMRAPTICRVRMDVWDSGVSRDDSLGNVSLSLDMAAENAIQVTKCWWTAPCA